MKKFTSAEFPQIAPEEDGPTTYASFFDGPAAISRRSSASSARSRPTSTVNFMGPSETPIINKEDLLGFLARASKELARNRETIITTYLSRQASKKETSKALIIATGGELSLLSLAANFQTSDIALRHNIFVTLLNQLVEATNQDKNTYPDAWIIMALQSPLALAAENNHENIIREILKSLAAFEDEPAYRTIILATLAHHLTNNTALEKFTAILSATPSKHRAIVLTTTTGNDPSIPVAILINESINDGPQQNAPIKPIINDIPNDATNPARAGAITRLKAQNSAPGANLLKIYLEFMTFDTIAKHLQNIRAAYLLEKKSSTPDEKRLDEITKIEAAVNTAYDNLFTLTSQPLIHDIIHTLLATVKEIADEVTTQHKQGSLFARLSITRSDLAEKIIPTIINERIMPICAPLGIAVPDMPMVRSGRTSSLK